MASDKYYVRAATVAEEEARSALWRHLWGKHLARGALRARGRAARERLERERRAPRAAAAARKGRAVKEQRPEAQAEVLSSCEVYLVPAMLGGAPSTVLLVATLFTEPALRGRGLAAALLEAVAAEAAARPRCAGVLLYSDIGAAYYETLGFRRLGSATDIVLPADADASADAGEGLSIAVEPAANLEDLDEADFNAELPLQGAAPGLLVLPVELARAGFVVALERFEAATRGLPPLARRGARCGGGAAGCCVWAADHEDGELLVLAIRASAPAAAAALLAAARREAAAAGLARVRLWLPEAAAAPATAAAVAAAAAALPGAARVERAKQLPMLRAVAGAGVEVGGLGLQRVHWW
jgi:predicted N-acetyltransferase YhbS